MTDKGTLRCPKELDSDGNWIAKQPRKAANKYEFCPRKLTGSITRLYKLYADFENMQNNIGGKFAKFSLNKFIIFSFSAVDFAQTPIYSIMEQAYLEILNNYETRDEHFPDYVPFFQRFVLPMALQQSDYNPDLIRTAPTAFPPSVDPNEASFVTKSIPIKWKYEGNVDERSSSFCDGKEDCKDPNAGMPNKNFISTKLYAVPGSIVKATIPSDYVGKIGVRSNKIQIILIVLTFSF